jgi:hypothetical protein
MEGWVLRTEDASRKHDIRTKALELEPSYGGGGPGNGLVGHPIRDLPSHWITLAGGFEHERSDLVAALQANRAPIHGEGHGPGIGQAEVSRHHPGENCRRASAIVSPNRGGQTGLANRVATAPIPRRLTQGVESGRPAVRSDPQAIHAAAADDADAPAPIRTSPQGAIAIVHDQLGGRETQSPHSARQQTLVARKIDSGGAVGHDPSERPAEWIQPGKRGRSFGERQQRGHAALGTDLLVRRRGAPHSREDFAVLRYEGHVRLGIANVHREDGRRASETSIGVRAHRFGPARSLS